MAEIGGVGEYPTQFIISPDKKYLLINFENKIKLLDLESKKIIELLILKHSNFNGMALSPDGTHIFIWDQEYASQDKNYLVYDFNISSKEKKILKQGILNQAAYLFPVNWRNDNKIIMGEAKGDYSNVWVYDLKTNNFQKVDDLYLGSLSGDGKLLALQKFSVSDPCNGYSGSDIGSYSIVDPVTAQKIDKIGDDKNVISFIAFSGDDKEILYEIMLPVTEAKNDLSDCDQQYDNQGKLKKYFKKIIGGEISQVDDLDLLLKSWNAEEVNAELKSENGKNVIIFEGSTIYSTGKGLSIIAEYYQ